MSKLRLIRFDQELNKEEDLNPTENNQIKWLYNYIKNYPDRDSAKIIMMLIDDAKNGYHVNF